MISAKEANHKFAVETKLLTDKETINYIVKRNKTFGEKIVNGINRMIQRKIGSKEQKFLAGVRKKWEAALEESRKEGDKKRPSGDGKVKNAYGKENHRVTKADVSYEALIRKPDMKMTILSDQVPYAENGKIDRKRIKSIAKKNVRALNNPNNTERQLFVNLRDLDLEIMITTDGIEHGLTRNEFTAKTTMRIGDILENSIIANELDPRGDELFSYVALGVGIDYEYNLYPVKFIVNVERNNICEVKNIKVYDKLYSSLTKKQMAPARGSTSPSGETRPSHRNHPKISIRNLLDIVKDHYPEILSDDVLSHYGMERPKSEMKGIRYSVGKEGDREYMDAVERGDMETAQRMVDQAAKAAGYTERLYHQTDAEFTVFEPRHKGAGSRDNETPYGIFMKTSSANIGLKGNKQMELYAKIQNPLVAYDRRSLRKMIESMSPEYRNLKEEIKNIDKEYGEKFENAKTGWTNYITEWRKNNPDAKRTALYDDPEFQRLFDEEDRIIAEWTEKASNLDERAKEEITRTLTDSGYDGIILSRDEGSFGRSTDAYIALDSSQVKSADAVTYDDTGNIIPLSERFDVGDADIRYSLGKEKRKVSAEMGELIKAYNAEMMGVFYERSAEDRRELWVFV